MNNPTNSTHKLIITAVAIALAVGLGGGYWLANDSTSDHGAKPSGGDRKILFYRSPMNPSVTSPVPAKDSMGMDYVPVYAENDKPKERKVLFYRSPMNPSVTSPVPAKDSMGMDYVPVYAENDDGADTPAGTVRIDPVTVQNIGVRKATAERRTLSRHVRAVGRVAYNEERLSRLHPKTEGWIDKLRVDKTGSQVKKNDILLSIYSPQLVSSQEEYLLALKNRQVLADSPFKDIRQGAIDLVKTARERLELLDVAKHQIRELEQTQKIKKYIHIHSPYTGIVMQVGAREGQYVTPKTQLYMLADLSKVWVYADIYEYELPWVRVGDPVEMQLSGVPGKTFKGHLAYIYPYAEAKTRTIKVRMEFKNEDLLLKPDMFAELTIQAGRQIDAVVIPAEAVVRSGTRDQVFIVRGPGKFEPREIRVGVTTSGMTQILEGVKAGEEVVSSALFLIDSESKLREATAKMLDARHESSRVPEKRAAGKRIEPLPKKSGPTMPKATNSKMGGMDMGGMNMGGMDMGGMDKVNDPEGGKEALGHKRAADTGGERKHD